MESIQKYITPLCLISLMVLLCVPEIDGTRPCTDDQYLHTLFMKCMPCKEICKPLNRSVCQTKCADYVRNLTACRTDQYWETLYGACINCTIICDPPSRDKCKEKCSGYIEILRTLTTKTPTVPNPTTDYTLTTERWITDRDAVIALITLIMTIASIVGLYCYCSKIAKCAKDFFTHRDDRLPIEETGIRGCQSDDPLVEQV